MISIIIKKSKIYIYIKHKHIVKLFMTQLIIKLNTLTIHKSNNIAKKIYYLFIYKILSRFGLISKFCVTSKKNENNL